MCKARWLVGCTALLLVSVVLGETVKKYDWSNFPSSVRSAKRRYDSALDEARKDYDKTVETAQTLYDETVADAKETYDEAAEEAKTPLEEALTDAQEKAQTRNDLDLALALRQAKDDLPVPEAELTIAETTRRLLGEWYVADKNHFTKRKFDFRPGGLVVITEEGGLVHNSRYIVTDERVVIQTNIGINEDVSSAIKYWFSFDVPLEDGRAKGDSWAGYGNVTARKLD